jgi:hypothetical protein
MGVPEPPKWVRTGCYLAAGCKLQAAESVAHRFVVSVYGCVPFSALFRPQPAFPSLPITISGSSKGVGFMIRIPGQR